MHDVLTNNQFGFRPKLSKKVAFVNFMADIRNNSKLNANVNHAAFMYLKKMIDFVSRDTILQKLKTVENEVAFRHC